MTTDRETQELEKLILEIKQLELPWWKKPSYLGVLVPVLLATLAFAGGCWTGYFDAERTRLQNDKRSLTAETRDLTERVARLKGQGQRVTRHLSDLLPQLQIIADRKLNELRRILVALEGNPAAEQIKTDTDAMVENIDEIRELIDKANAMLGELPDFGT